MIDIGSLASGYSQKDTVDAIYYTARFVKQAALLQHEKDIFEEDDRSAPSAQAKNLCGALIAAIEAEAGKVAAKLSDTAVAAILHELTSAADIFENDLSPIEEREAETLLRSMTIPEVSRGSLDRRRQ